jgi:hypothetical protein
LKRAGMPSWLAPVFPLAISETRIAAAEGANATAATPLRLALSRILARLEGMEGEGYRRLISYLRGLEAEAVRGEARALAEAMITLDETEAANAAGIDQPLSEAEAGMLDLEDGPAPLDLDAVAVGRAA